LRRFGKRNHRIDADTVMRPLNRDEYLFIELGHKIVLYIEAQGRHPRILYLESIDKWQMPYENEMITTQDKERIAHKVIEYFANIGEKCEAKG
jgi:hypothetical protein